MVLHQVSAALHCFGQLGGPGVDLSKANGRCGRYLRSCTLRAHERGCEVA
jgi:hypothetical protein